MPLREVAWPLLCQGSLRTGHSRGLWMAQVANMEAGGKPEIGLQAGRLSGGWKVVWSSRIGRGRLGRKVEQGAVFGVLEKGVQL